MINDLNKGYASLDPDLSFWEAYPQFKTAGPFKDLYKSDKSRNKMVSSKKAWFVIALFNRTSIYFSLPEEGEDSKFRIVGEDMFEDVEYYNKNKELIDELGDFYEKTSCSQLERDLKGYLKKFNERKQFLLSTEYTLDYYEETESGRTVTKKGTADQLDKMFIGTDKIAEMIDKMQKLVKQEKDKGVAKGGQRESLSDTGEI